MTQENPNDNPRLVISPTSPPQEVARRFFQEFYSRNAFQFAVADIFCLNGVALNSRISELLTIFLLGVRDADGKDPIRDYMIVLPPISSGGADDESSFRQHLADSLSAHRGSPLSAKESAILAGRIQVHRSGDLDIPQHSQRIAIHARAISSGYLQLRRIS